MASQHGPEYPRCSRRTIRAAHGYHPCYLQTTRKATLTLKIGSLCLQVLGPKAGLAMFSLTIVAQFFVGQGLVNFYPLSCPSHRTDHVHFPISHCCTVASSRVVYAYSRDGALPGSRWWKQVNSYTKTPVNAVWFVVMVGALLGLLMFASPVAIGAVFSIGAIAQYTAFIIPIALKLLVVGDKFRPGEFVVSAFNFISSLLQSFSLESCGGRYRKLERKKKTVQLIRFLPHIANLPS
jgi:amino acid transporter